MSNSKPSSLLYARQLVDPRGTLPAVELKDSGIKAPRDPAATIFNILHEGEIIGATVITDYDEKTRMFKRLRFHEDWLDVHNRTRVKGLATAVYLAAIETALEEGKSIRCDDESVSPGAVRIWRNFVEKGVAEEAEPFTFQPSSYRDGDTYKGSVIVRFAYARHIERLGDISSE